MDGFVPTENLRFREAGLVFKVSDSATEEEIKRLAHYNYPLMIKELGEYWVHIYKVNYVVSPVIAHLPIQYTCNWI